jgi:hypothetical protein
VQTVRLGLLGLLIAVKPPNKCSVLLGLLIAVKPTN